MLLATILGVIVATAGVFWQISNTSSANDESLSNSGESNSNILVKDNTGSTNINVNLRVKYNPLVKVTMKE